MNQGIDEQAKQPDDKNNGASAVFSLGKGLGLAAAITGYILGPLLVLGGLGYWLSKKYDNFLFLAGALIIAFVVSNYTIYRRAKHLADKFDSDHRNKNL